jgi:hypothetical protein
MEIAMLVCMVLCAALAMFGGINMDMHGTTSLGHVLVGLPMQKAYRTLVAMEVTHLGVQCNCQHCWPLGMEVTLLDAQCILTPMRDISLLLHLSLQAK